MIEACMNCERRSDNDIPSGSGEKVAKDRGAKLSGCLDVCNRFSVSEKIQGVNYIDKIEGRDDEVGTIVVDSDGQPLNRREVYEPVRISFDYTDASSIKTTLPE